MEQSIQPSIQSTIPQLQNLSIPNRPIPEFLTKSRHFRAKETYANKKKQEPLLFIRKSKQWQRSLLKRRQELFDLCTLSKTSELDDDAPGCSERCMGICTILEMALSSNRYRNGEFFSSNIVTMENIIQLANHYESLSQKSVLDDVYNSFMCTERCSEAGQLLQADNDMCDDILEKTKSILPLFSESVTEELEAYAEKIYMSNPATSRENLNKYMCISCEEEADYVMFQVVDRFVMKLCSEQTDTDFAAEYAKEKRNASLYQSQLKEQQKQNSELLKRAEKAELQLKELKFKMENRPKEKPIENIAHIRNSYESEIAGLKKEIEELKTKNQNLDTELTAAYEEQNSMKEEQVYPDIDYHARYLFVGGHPATLKLLLERFPESDAVGNVTEAERKNVFGYDLIIFITTAMTHSLYEKVKNICRTNHLAYLNTSKRNAYFVAKDIATYLDEKKGIVK